jgi:asparagine synthase (glutamine-hydrolysing)
MLIKNPSTEEARHVFGNQSGKIQSFSAVFTGFENTESVYINKVCDHLDIKNYPVFPSASDLIKEFEKICYHQEEPFQSSGIYAQYKVFELAAHHRVKVLLDGQGADEVLAGYPKFIHWYLQEVLSRHRLGSAQLERKAFQKNEQPFQWDIKNIIAAFLPSHAAIQLEKKEYLKTIHHPDIILKNIKRQGMGRHP